MNLFAFNKFLDELKMKHKMNTVRFNDIDTEYFINYQLVQLNKK